MLISQNRKQLVLNSTLELGEDLTVEKKGKGRKFVSRFIEAGVAHYQEFGDILITKETLDKFIHTMVGCPLIINHKEITDKNADKERVGVISNVWFNDMDGWYYCDGIIWDLQAIDLVKNQGWSVSCTYDFVSDNLEKTHNGKQISMEFIDGEFLHLALVNNPRYERANIVINSKDQVENVEFRTGIDKDGNKYAYPLEEKKVEKTSEIKKDKKEKSEEEKIEEINTFKKIIEDKQKNKEYTKDEIKEAITTIIKNKNIKSEKELWQIFGNESNLKLEISKILEKPTQKKGIEQYKKISEIDKIKEQNTPSEEKEIERLIDIADSVSMFNSGSTEKRLNEKAIKELDEIEISEEKKEETKQKLKELHKDILKKLANAPSQYKVGLAEFNKRVGLKKSSDNLDKAYSLQAQRDNIIKELKENIKKEKTKQQNISLGEKAKEALSKGLMEFEHNGKTWFRTSKRSKSYIGLDKYTQSKYDKMKSENKAQNGKDLTIMTVLKDLEKFIKGIVDNACDKEEKVENEDKRKIIDEVGGILKDKVDEEVWRTVIGKLEKIAYNPSETDKADNKCKNEDDEEKEEKEEKFEEEKEIAENKKAKNEDKEDKEEDKKEDKADNKCAKNSMDDIAGAIMGGNVKTKTVSSYVSQSDRLKAGENY